MITDDPIADFNRWDAEINRRLASRPCCEKCGEPILTETAIYYEDQWICEFCEQEFWDDIRSDFLESVEDDA